VPGNIDASLVGRYRQSGQPSFAVPPGRECLAAGSWSPVRRV
jgi:hypothetical protein